MEEQQTKRPIFTPIVLILLTISLIGNVFLYSKMLQNDQSDKVDRGTAIIQSGNAAKAFLDLAVVQTGELIAKSDIASRLSVKSKLLVAYSQASSTADFIEEAEASNGKPFSAPKRSAAEFVDQTLTSLEAIGNHDGPLTDAEKAYLGGLLEVFKACQQELSSFQHDTINQEQSLAILVDGGWPPIADKLLAHMNEPDDIVFKS